MPETDAVSCFLCYGADERSSMLEVQVSTRPAVLELVRMICMNCARAVAAAQSKALDERNGSLSDDRGTHKAAGGGGGSGSDAVPNPIDSGFSVLADEPATPVDRSKSEAVTGSEGIQEESGVASTERVSLRRGTSHKQQCDN
jgi:hypothetical protein